MAWKCWKEVLAKRASRLSDSASYHIFRHFPDAIQSLVSLMAKVRPV